MSDLRARLRLVLIADGGLLGGNDPSGACLEAVRGGASAVLLRLAEASPRDLAKVARTLRSRLDVPVLVAERADVAIAAGAAGVHLGRDDIPVALVRRVSPRGFLIGASVANPGDVEGGRGADYWLVGPWPRGFDGAAFGTIRRLAEGRPCVAFGGLGVTDLEAIGAAGAAGAAIGAEVLARRDLATAVGAYAAMLVAPDAGRRG